MFLKDGSIFLFIGLSGGAVILAEMDGKVSTKPINSDAIKKYYI